MRKTNKYNKGFNLIESLVAVSIFAMIVSTFMALMYRSIAVSASAKDQITATYLAQDAVEYIEMALENNTLQGKADWLSGLRSCVGGSNKKCTVDTFNDNLNNYVKNICPSGNCPYLKFSESLRRYGYNNGGDWHNSRFAREVTLDEIEADQELKVTVSISWHSGSISKNFTLYSSLFNFNK